MKKTIIFVLVTIAVSVLSYQYGYKKADEIGDQVARVMTEEYVELVTGEKLPEELPLGASYEEKYYACDKEKVLRLDIATKVLQQYSLKIEKLEEQLKQFSNTEEE